MRETANWMSVFAFNNLSTSSLDLGPPMYVVSEDTDPFITQNPSFELAYWHFGLQLAEQWFDRLGKPDMAGTAIAGTANVSWSGVRQHFLVYRSQTGRMTCMKAYRPISGPIQRFE